MKKLLIGIVFLSLMCSCSGIGKQKDNLIGKNYILQIEQQSKDKKIKLKEDKKKETNKKEDNKKKNEEKNYVTISFNDENFYGNGGINRYFGKYEAKNGKINFKYFASTKVAGKKEDMEKENKYFKVLNNVDKYKIEKDTLILSTPNGNTLKYKEELNKTKNKKGDK